MNSENLIKLAKLISELKKKVKCFVCQDFIKNAAEIKCGHTFCNECIKSQTLCPICHCILNKRTPIYRDEFLNSLSKFVDSTCQVIKEKYVEDVDILQDKSNKNVAKIIETAPQNIHNMSADLNVPIIESKEIMGDEVVKVIQYPKKNKTNLTKENIRVKVAKWLSENKDKHGSVKQNQDIVGIRSLDDMDYVSVTQENKAIHLRVMSESLILPNEIQNILKKTNHSFTQGLSDNDNYAIVDIQSEEQVERKVLQDILEDECLANLENVAKQNEKSDADRVNMFDNRNLNPSTSSFDCPSGHDRLGSIKKSLRFSKKEPKKLKIVLQNNHNERVKDTVKKSGKRRKKNISKPFLGASVQNKENPIKIVKTNMKVNQEVLNNFSGKNINRKDDIIEANDFSKHFDDKKLCKNISDENVFLIATQKTGENEKQKKVYYFPPVSEEINDMDGLINILSENVNTFIEESTSFNDEISLTLINCFGNLKTYIKKWLHLHSEQQEQSHLTPKIKVNISTQTKNVVKKDKQMQTSAIQKCTASQQTSQKLFKEVGVQTIINKFNPTQNCTTLTKTNISKEEKELKFVDAVLNKIELSTKSKTEIKPDHGTQSSVLFCSLKSSELGMSAKKVNKRLFNDDSMRKFKRIRQPSNSDSDEDGHAKKIKLIRDDLTVEFQDSENVNSKELIMDMSENMDYDNYLLKVMAKYGTPQKIFSNNKDNKISNCEKAPQHNNGSSLFTGQTLFEENMNTFEKELQKSGNYSKAVDTECDIVENTPMIVQNIKKSKFLVSESKDKSNITKESHKQILNKSSVANSENGDKLLNLLLQHGTSATDALSIINDLQNEENFFSEDFGELKAKKKEETQTNQKGLTENIDEILKEMEVDDADDNQVEKELENISFTAEINNLNQKNCKINILQNLTIQEAKDDIIDSSDDSEREIIESTPQKKKTPSFNRTLVTNLEDPNLDICLPPPPGFGDDLEDNIEREVKELVDNTSLTPDRLSELIEESRRNDQAINNIHDQNVNISVENKKIAHNSQTVHDLCADIFSPIAKSSLKILKSNFTPLVNNLSSNVRKPNMLTSTPNQKSILNYVNYTQTKNKLKKSKPCLMWSRISNKDIRNVFRQLEVKRLITVSENFTQEVTHLIVAVDEKGQLKSHTAKFLLAVAAGIWVVRCEWVVDCLKTNSIVSEELYEVLDISGVPGPQISRLTRIKSPLFKGYTFFCAPTFSTISINDIESIVRMLDGEIAAELSSLLLSDKIKIILTDTSATEDLDKFDEWLETYETVTVDIEWFIKCVAQYKLLSFRPFILCSEDNICDLNYPDVLIESVPFVLTETM